MRVHLKPKGRLFIGIDPGATGALCALDSAGQTLHMMKLPTIKTRRGQTKLDSPTLREELSNMDINYVCVEDIWAQPTQGVKAAFTYGYCYGQLCDCIEAAGVGVEFITPATWQKAYKVPKGKESSIHIAVQFYPSLKSILKFKKSHNEADAVLIARYCWEKYCHADRRTES